MINLPEFNKVIVSYSGGLDSTLVALASIEKYGKENVTLCYVEELDKFNEDTGTSLQGEVLPSKLLGRRKIFNQMSEMLEVNHYIVNPAAAEDFPNDVHMRLEAVKASLVANHGVSPEAQYVMGFSLKVKNIIQLQRLNASEDGVVQDINMDDIEAAVNADPEKYRGVIGVYGIGNMHKHSPDFLSGTYSKLPSKIISMLDAGAAPLFNMSKSDIVNEYVNRSWESYMFSSLSCALPTIQDDVYYNCGTCDNCISRKKAFSDINVEDKTIYIA